MKNNTLVVSICAIIILGLIIFVTHKPRVEGPANPDTEQPAVVQSYRTTLAGEYVCLPHKNTDGPQTMECAFGIKTDEGKYYALDFNLSSQTPPNFTMGERIEATGLVTPVEMLSAEMWRQYPITGILSVTDGARKLVEDGRVSVMLALGEKGEAMDLSIRPIKILTDSRCPIGVQCIWAGTVEVKASLATKTTNGELTFKLGEPQVFGGYTAMFVVVSPEHPSTRAIPDSSYRLTFEVKKN